jgi:antitoxin component YwqK of YwqJK toxin-antitoxin module
MGNLFSTSKENKLEQLKKICTKYTNWYYGEHVFGICNDYLIVMKKHHDSIINENRENIFDKNYVKYTTNVLDVVAIYNINTLEQYFGTVSYVNKDFKVCFKSGCPVYADQYEFNKDNAGFDVGIAYYKTIERAFYARDLPLHYNGEWIEWYDNGQQMSTCNYCTIIDQIISFNSEPIYKKIKTGLYTKWYKNGNLAEVGEYSKDNRTGKWTFYDENGKIREEGEYSNGFRTGKWIKYNSD